MDEGTAYYIALSELKEATNDFSKKIGKGSFGSVYYGKMRDGKEIAVKTMTDPSSHGNQQFVNEVAFQYLNPDRESVLYNQPFQCPIIKFHLQFNQKNCIPCISSAFSVS